MVELLLEFEMQNRSCDTNYTSIVPQITLILHTMQNKAVEGLLRQRKYENDYSEKTVCGIIDEIIENLYITMNAVISTHMQKSIFETSCENDLVNYSDLTLIVGCDKNQIQFKCHKIVLFNSTEPNYFENFTNFSSMQTNNNICDSITVVQFDPKILFCVLTLVYSQNKYTSCGSITIKIVPEENIILEKIMHINAQTNISITYETLIEIFVCADFLGYDDICKFIELTLCKNITKQHAAHLTSILSNITTNTYGKTLLVHCKQYLFRGLFGHNPTNTTQPEQIVVSQDELIALAYALSSLVIHDDNSYFEYTKALLNCI